VLASQLTASSSPSDQYAFCIVASAKTSVQASEWPLYGPSDCDWGLHLQSTNRRITAGIEVGQFSHLHRIRRASSPVSDFAVDLARFDPDQERQEKIPAAASSKRQNPFPLAGAL
jgi:hypothetical protein